MLLIHHQEHYPLKLDCLTTLLMALQRSLRLQVLYRWEYPMVCPHTYPDPQPHLLYQPIQPEANHACPTTAEARHSRQTSLRTPAT